MAEWVLREPWTGYGYTAPGNLTREEAGESIKAQIKEEYLTLRALYQNTNRMTPEQIGRKLSYFDDGDHV